MVFSLFLNLYLSCINLIFFILLFFGNKAACSYDFLLTILFFSVVTFVFPLFLLIIAYVLVSKYQDTIWQSLKAWWQVNLVSFAILAMINIVFLIFQDKMKCIIYFG